MILKHSHYPLSFDKKCPKCVELFEADSKNFRPRNPERPLRGFDFLPTEANKTIRRKS